MTRISSAKLLGFFVLLQFGCFPAFAQQLNLGGVDIIEVDSAGFGSTKDEALLDALDNAVSSVNGRRIGSANITIDAEFEAGLNGVALGTIGSSAYVDAVVSASKGAVAGYEVIDSGIVPLERASFPSSRADDTTDPKPSSQRGFAGEERWKVSIAAKVAYFDPAEDQKKPSLVIAVPKVSSAQFQLGGSSFSSLEIAESVKAGLADVLVQSNRFNVLGREYENVLQSEVDFILSGNSRTIDVARVGQQLAADLLLVTEITQLQFLPETRQLRQSSRTLVSYEGRGEIRARLIDATSGKMIASESFNVRFDPIGPTSMPLTVDDFAISRDAISSMSEQVSSMVIRRTFPVSVLDISGSSVVLSQGGQAIQVGSRFNAVALGTEMIDPQTGVSLGRAEIPCCVVEINRVSDRLSYGTIEGQFPFEASEFSAGLIELRGPVMPDLEESVQTSLDDLAPTVNEPIRSVTPLKDDTNW